MEATAQMNTRINRSVKDQGDAVLARFGFTPSQAVRELWTFVCTHQDVPAFMKASETDAAQLERDRKLSLIRGGQGLAIRIAQEQCGYTGPTSGLIGDATWHEMRDDMYDDMLDEMERRCR